METEGFWRLGRPMLNCKRFCARSVVLVWALAAHFAVSADELLKGISYGPVPCLEAPPTPLCIHQDDFMAAEAKALWGSRYRADLTVMKQLGANHVRLYGNNPANLHANFLNEVAALDMKAIVGMSDWPYTQSPNNCAFTNDYNCYSQVKESYLGNLQKGFLLPSGEYHPGVAEVIVINEPDLKMPRITMPKLWSKGIISAVDGMLDAEKTAGAKGTLVNFTVTFSFGICQLCTVAKEELGLTSTDPPPAIGQMADLRAAFMDPLSVGYTAKNDLAEFYRTRFVNSFNTANPAGDIEKMFLPDYEDLFPTVPVTIQEYHKPDRAFDQEKDLKEILNIARNSGVLRGISFFEFQVRYDKGGTEADFGMFGLDTAYNFKSFDYFGDTVDSYCLKPIYDDADRPIPSAVAAAFGGHDIDYSALCKPDPAKVPIDQVGFKLIQNQSNVSRMSTFVERVARHFGGKVQDDGILRDVSTKYSNDGTFDTLVKEVAEKPNWIAFDPQATCAADRAALVGDVVSVFGTVCGSLTTFDCAEIPEECSNDIWLQADYALSMFYKEKGMNPLKNCYFDGSAVLASEMVFGEVSSQCLVSKNPLFSALSNDGYLEVLTNKDPSQTSLYMRRVVVNLLDGDVTDDASLEAFAQNPPDNFNALTSSLEDKQWICGARGHKACPTTSSVPTTSGSTQTATPDASTPRPVVPLPPHRDRGSGPSRWTYVGYGILLFVVILLAATIIASTLNARARRKKATARAATRKKGNKKIVSFSDTEGDSSDSSSEPDFPLVVKKQSSAREVQVLPQPAPQPQTPPQTQSYPTPNMVVTPPPGRQGAAYGLATVVPTPTPAAQTPAAPSPCSAGGPGRGPPPPGACAPPPPGAMRRVPAASSSTGSLGYAACGGGFGMQGRPVRRNISPGKGPRSNGSSSPTFPSPNQQLLPKPPGGMGQGHDPNFGTRPVPASPAFGAGPAPL